jgi:hypothetical protein
MKAPLLPPEVRDQAVEVIRRMETLCGLLEAASESSIEVDASMTTEALYMIGEEAARLRQVLRLDPRPNGEVRAERTAFQKRERRVR